MLGKSGVTILFLYVIFLLAVGACVLSTSISVANVPALSLTRNLNVLFMSGKEDTLFEWRRKIFQSADFF